MILLPEYLKNWSEWVQIAQILSKTKKSLWESIYRSQKIYIEKILTIELCDQFNEEDYYIPQTCEDILKSIPTVYQKNFIFNVTNKFKLNLSHIIKTNSDLREMLYGLNHDFHQLIIANLPEQPEFRIETWALNNLRQTLILLSSDCWISFIGFYIMMILESKMKKFSVSI